MKNFKTYTIYLSVVKSPTSGNGAWAYTIVTSDNIVCKRAEFRNPTPSKGLLLGLVDALKLSLSDVTDLPKKAVVVTNDSYVAHVPFQVNTKKNVEQVTEIKLLRKRFFQFEFVDPTKELKYAQLWNQNKFYASHNQKPLIETIFSL